MASPQTDNGFTRIANEIMEALTKYRIPGEQMQCLLFILRKTYGYNKIWDTISNSQFVENTGLKKPNVCRAINKLVDKKLVIKKDNNYIPSYRFNKNYDRWKLLSKKITYEIPGRVSINDIKEKIRERDNNICLLCGCDGNLILDKAPVHHIDFNQTNNDDNNLITLCKSCHAKCHTKQKKEEILSHLKGVIKSDNLVLSKKIPTKDIITKDIYKEEFKFKIKVPIPKNIFLTNKMKAYVVKQGCDNRKHAESLFEDFVNHFLKNGKKWVNWTRTFYTWVRNDKKYYNSDRYKEWVDVPTERR